MILSDHDISRLMEEGDIQIHPLPDHQQIQPASIDLRLGGEFAVPTAYSPVYLDEADAIKYDVRNIQENEHFVLGPGDFVLGTTIEHVTLGRQDAYWHTYSPVVGRVDGRSSIGRLGVLIHVTAGFIDPGFSGQVTLEIHNVSPNTILLKPGMRVCQISFMRMSSHPNKPYQGKYQNQRGVGISKIYKDSDHGRK